MVQTKEEHRIYMQEWRAKRRAKKDLIEKRILGQSKRVYQPQQPRVKRDIGIWSDKWGVEPTKDLRPQYPKEKESMGFNIFASDSEAKQPKRKSYQQQLKDLYPNHAE